MLHVLCLKKVKSRITNVLIINRKIRPVLSVLSWGGGSGNSGRKMEGPLAGKARHGARIWKLHKRGKYQNISNPSHSNIYLGKSQTKQILKI